MGADLDRVRRSGLGVAREPGRVLFVGRLVEKKGLAILLAALRTLPPGWSLEVAGDGPLRSALEEQARGLPVIFLGQTPRAQLAQAYARCAVLAVPSVPAASGDQDGLPVALLEVMGAACAVVASRIAAIDEAVVDGESGLLVPLGSTTELAAALARLLGDDALCRQLGAGAATRAEQYSVSSIGRRYLEVPRAAPAPGLAGRAGGRAGGRARAPYPRRAVAEGPGGPVRALARLDIAVRCSRAPRDVLHRRGVERAADRPR